MLNNAGGKFSFGKIFSSSIEIENFAAPWSMKRPRTMALAAGSVFEIKKTDNSQFTAADVNIITDKIYKGFGERNEEGFGQLRIWKAEPLTTSKDNNLKDSANTAESSFTSNLSDKTKEIAALILNKHFLVQIKIYAHEDAEKLRP